MFYVSSYLKEYLPSLHNSDVLQAEHMTFAGAVSCIEATMQTLQDMQIEEEWKKNWERAVSLSSILIELHWKSTMYKCIILC